MAAQLGLKKEVYAAFKEGKFRQAEERILSLMDERINNTEAEELLKMLKFWQNRREYLESGSDTNRGERLYSEWEHFADFCTEQGIGDKKAALALKQYVFSIIVDDLIESYRMSPLKDKETLILLGQAFYELGMVEKAAETLEYAVSLSDESDDVRLYSLLGDLYAEMGEEDLAMVMFNEAFYKSPQMIDLRNISYGAIRRLKEMVENDGVAENETVEWIPVYGYFFRGLTARRNLSYNEYLALRDRVKDYENSLKVDKKVRNIIVPRLINYYIWVFDYYVFQVRALQAALKVADRMSALIRQAGLSEQANEKLFLTAQKVCSSLVKGQKDKDINVRPDERSKIQ